MKLFDYIVTPVMLYCSELWGITCTEKDTNPYEYIHLKFIKEILGVHSKTSNDACSELWGITCTEKDTNPYKYTLKIHKRNFRSS